MTDSSDRLCRAVTALVELLSRLRGPGGCPWDARQNHESIKLYLLEEAYEVVEALEHGWPEDVCAELGDLFFQICFLAQMAAERREFDLAEVMEGVTRKMIRRHPHVFGSHRVDSAEEVALNWSRIKQSEQGNSASGAELESVPRHLPALLRAHRLGERADKAGLSWDAARAWQEVCRSFEALRSCVESEQADKVPSEIGALLFTVAQLARSRGANAENLLRWQNQAFLERFQRMEEFLSEAGIRLESATPDDILTAWDKAAPGRAARLPRAETP